MTTRAMNWYISARTGLVLGGSVQVCPATDAAAAEVRAALEADGVPVRVEGEMLWAGEGPSAKTQTTEATPRDLFSELDALKTKISSLETELFALKARAK